MPWPVYTETFVKLVNVQAQGLYRVPLQKRAVVKSLIAINYADVAGYLNFNVGGVCVALVLFPAAPRNTSLAITAVAYAGQTISVISSVAGYHAVMSGYLMSDLSGAAGPPAGAATLPADPPVDPPEFGEPGQDELF